MAVEQFERRFHAKPISCFRHELRQSKAVACGVCLHHLAVVPEAQRVGNLGVRLLLCPNDHIQNAVRVLRDQSRQSGSCPRSRDGASDRFMDGPADCRMLRLGSSAGSFPRSRPRQLLWHHLRSARAPSRYCPGSRAVQIASGQRHRRALGEIGQVWVPGPRVHIQ